MDSSVPSPVSPARFQAVAILQQVLEQARATAATGTPMVRLLLVGRANAIEGSLVSASPGVVELEVGGSRQFVDPARIEAVVALPARR